MPDEGIFLYLKMLWNAPDEYCKIAINFLTLSVNYSPWQTVKQFMKL